MTLEQFIEPIHNITRIRIVKGKGSRYETSEADVYIGWLGILREDKSQISKEIWQAEIKDFAVVPDIRHKDWQKLGLMKPLEQEWRKSQSRGGFMETILTDTIKSSMRILSKSAVIEQDINNSIAACKLDLQLAGVVNINENDALIIRAVTLFVKAEFNFQNAADRYRQSYEALKMSLCLAGDYNTKEG